MSVGQIGLAIRRRMVQDMKVVVGDTREASAAAGARLLTDAGFDAVARVANPASRESIETSAR